MFFIIIILLSLWWLCITIIIMIIMIIMIISWFVSLPSQDYRAQKQRLAEQFCSSGVQYYSAGHQSWATIIAFNATGTIGGESEQ